MRKFRNMRGFTMAELLIVMVVLFVGCGVAAASCEYAIAPSQKEHAEEYARQYAREFMGLPAATVSCMGVDTDRNGYVTCNVSGGQGAPVRQIECVANALIEVSTGCREYRLRTIDLNGNN